MRRVRVLSRQLAAAEEPVDPRRMLKAYSRGVRRLQTHEELPSMTLYELQLLLPPGESRPPAAHSRATGNMLIGSVDRALAVAEADGSLAALELLPGPWQDAPTRAEKLALLARDRTAQLQGCHTQLYAEYQRRYGDCDLGSNIAVPCIVVHSTATINCRAEAVPEGFPDRLRVVGKVLLADPSDAERVARIHVRKEPNFGLFMDSVISTTDNEHWRAQREHLTEAFLPISSLAQVNSVAGPVSDGWVLQILPVSLSRAKSCAERLAEMASFNPLVDMSDFLLHEAQAQLQLALLGAPEDLMERTNAQLRGTFMMDRERAEPGMLSSCMKELMQMAKRDSSLALPSDTAAVRGPLARAIQTGGFHTSTDYGNMLIILFAGGPQARAG